MAKNNKAIQALNPTGFEAPFTHTASEGAPAVTGVARLAGDKTPISMGGVVENNKGEQIASFSGNQVGEGLRFNITDIAQGVTLAEVGAAIDAAYAAVLEDLAD